jgi:hypothetical protein
MKKVLVEDITGHRCGNCPRAAETIVTLEATYPEQVIALGVHSLLSPSFCDPLTADTTINPEGKYTYDFRSSVGFDIDNEYGVWSAGLPNGLVNRKSYSGSHIVGYTTWSSHVASELSTPQQVDIQLQNFWDPVTHAICTFYYVEAMQNLNSSYNMALYIMEDSLVHWQKDYMATPSTDIEFYTHRHVLRGVVNGTWLGTPINNLQPLVNGEAYQDNYTVTIDPAIWDINHLYIVAVVFDNANKEVLQVEELKIIP